MINHSMRASEAIGTIIRNAIVFNVKNWGKRPMPDSDIFATVERLFDLLAAKQIKFVLVGGIVVLQYVEGRNTEDIDLIIALSDIKKLPEIKIIESDLYFSRCSFDDLQIDFLLTRNPLFKKVQRSYQTVITFQDRQIPCVTVEGLLLLKLYTLPLLYQQGNFARVNLYESDIARLLFSYRSATAPLFTVLQKYLSASDLQAVMSIVAEMETRITRFQNIPRSE